MVSKQTSRDLIVVENVRKSELRNRDPTTRDDHEKKLIELKCSNEHRNSSSSSSNGDTLDSSLANRNELKNEMQQQQQQQNPQFFNNLNSDPKQMVMSEGDADEDSGSGAGSGGDNTQTSDQSNSLVECRYRPQKYCAVCGDKAIACNFNAVTCESCKAFFRRNAFKEQRLKCLFENRCIIDRVTRRFCSKCRLLKCFSIGMKREWILTDEQKQIKRAKIMQNKQTRQQQVTTSSPNPSAVSTPPQQLKQRKKYSDCDSSLSSLASEPSPNTTTHTASTTTYVLTNNGSHCQRATVLDDNGESSGKLALAAAVATTTRDAATCCPDKSDLADGALGHYCSLAQQCQFCSTKITYEQHPPPQQQQSQVLICNAMYPNHQPKPATQFLGDYDRGHPNAYHQHANHMQSQLIYHQQQQAAGAVVPMLTTPAAANPNSYNQQMIPSEMSNGCAANLVDHHHHQAARSQFDMIANCAASCYCLQTAPSTPSSNQIYQQALGEHQTAPAAAQSDHNQHLTSNPSQLSSLQQQQQQETFVPNLHLLKPAINKSYQQQPPATIDDLLERANNAVNLTRSTINAKATDQAPPTNRNPFALALDSATLPTSQTNSPIVEQNELTCLRTTKYPKRFADESEGGGQPPAVAPKCNEVQTCASQQVDSGVRENTTSGSTTQPAVPEPRPTADTVQQQQQSVAQQQIELPIDNCEQQNAKKVKLHHYLWKGETYYEPASTAEEVGERIKRLNFNDTERQLITEMMEATRYLFDNNYDRSTPPSTLDEIVIFCDFSLRRLIKSFKQIQAFRILSMDDQILLLKTACFKVLLLRSAYHYYDEFDGFYDQKSGRRMKLDILKRATKSLVYEKHIELLQTIALPLRRDRVILSILAMAMLFDPNVNLKHTSSVELDNLIYLSILRKYLVGLQPDPLAKYKRLVEALQVLNACNEEYNIFFSRDFQPEQVTPLLIEVFDIPIKPNSD